MACTFGNRIAGKILHLRASDYSEGASVWYKCNKKSPCTSVQRLQFSLFHKGRHYHGNLGTANKRWANQNPNPNNPKRSYGNTLVKPKSDQTGFSQVRWIHDSGGCAMMVLETTNPSSVPSSQDYPSCSCCPTVREIGVLAGHPWVLEVPPRLWQRQGGDAGNGALLISGSSKIVGD